MWAYECGHMYTHFFGGDFENMICAAFRQIAKHVTKEFSSYMPYMPGPATATEQRGGAVAGQAGAASGMRCLHPQGGLPGGRARDHIG